MAAPGSLARRYAPFLLLAAVQVLLIAVVPSTGGPDGGTLVAGPGAAPGEDAVSPTEEIAGDDSTGTDVTTDGGSAGNSSGGGSTAGGGGGSAGGGGGTGGSSGGSSKPTGTLTADRSKCAKDGRRQQDITITSPSPPCVPRWSGFNGGHTYQGVSETEVVIIKYRVTLGEQVDAILRLQGLASTRAEEAHAATAFAKFFEKHNEFYGRRINWIDFESGCKVTPPDLPCFRQDARDLNKQYHPFAVFWTNSTVQAEFFDEWSRLGVVNVGGWHFNADFNQQRRPYHWDIFMDGTRTARNLADFWCKKMQGKNADKAGDPNMWTKKRKVGIITQDYEVNRKNAVDFLRFVSGEMCGSPSEIVKPFYTPSDINQAQLVAPAAMKAMYDEGATTVVFMTDPIGPRFYTGAATGIGYYPENLLAGSGLIDYDVLARLYDPPQWKNAFGPGHLSEPIPFNQSDAPKVAADVGVTGLYSGANLLFGYMNAVAAMVQMSGPTLTPANVERGMHTLPAAGGWERTRNPASILVKWGPGDYTAIEDSRHAWWNPNAVSKIDGEPGAYIAVENGRRWEIGTWTAGSPKP